MNTILKSWHESGFKTVFDAEEGDKKPEKKAAKTTDKKPRYTKKERSEDNKQSMKDSWEIILSDIEEDRE